MIDTEQNGKPIAIFCGSINLSLTPPALRRNEPNWLSAMARPLDEIKEISENLNVPIFCAGGIFNYWKAEPELISFAMEHISFMYAIPGKNDIPFDNIDYMERSAFHTLENAGIIISLDRYCAIDGGNYIVVNFPCEKGFDPPKIKGITSIALINTYRWIKQLSELKNPHINPYKEYLSYCEFSIFGDNNIPFCNINNKYATFNCGSLIRREIDEVNHRPKIGILTDKHKIISHELDSNVHDIISS